jgi:hypothetical protein
MRTWIRILVAAYAPLAARFRLVEGALRPRDALKGDDGAATRASRPARRVFATPRRTPGRPRSLAA